MRRPERSGDRARSPRFFFFLYVSFFLLLSFPSSFPFPWRRGFAATPSFFFLLLFFFLFFLFVFLLFFLLFSFCFFLFIFLLIFYSCFSLSFLFTFSFFLLFLFSLFFVFLFALLFILLTPISFLIIQPLAGHSFFLPRRQFLPFYPATSGSGKKEKISAKESTVVRWLPGSERAEGGKTEGRNGAPRGMEKMYTTRDGTMGGKK